MYQLGKLSAQDRDTKTLQLFEEELKSFPTSDRAWFSLWGHRYKIANRSIQAKTTITAEIRQLYEAHRSDPWAYKAAVLGFNQLGSNDEAVAIMREFVKRFPQDSSMDSLIPTFFGNWGNLEDLESLSARSQRWEDNSYYWYRLFQAYRSIKAEPERFYKVGKKLLALTPQEKDPGGNTRFNIAEIWLEFGVDPKEAERVAREAVAIAEIGERPGFVSFSKEQKKIVDRRVIVNVNRSVLGWALYHQQRYEEALKELEQAAKLREKENIISRNVYYRLGKVLEKLSRPKEAMEAYLKELAWGVDSEQKRADIAELYRRLNGNLDGLESFIRSGVNDLIMQIVQQYVEHVQDADEDLGRFDLPDSQGQPINLNQYKGKVVIIDFWATWCAPCLKSLEHTHKLQQASPDQIVVIAVSQDPEETHNRAVEYLSKKGYNFILAFDNEKKRSIELPYVPARFILDRQGRLRVRELGYSKETEFLFEKKLVAALAKVEKQTDSENMASMLRSMFFIRDYEGGYIPGKKFVSQFPQNLELCAWFILNMAKNSMEKEAVAEAEKMVKTNKNSAWSWFALAGALNWAQERGEEALKASESALPIEPEHPDIIWMRAETLMRQNKFIEAADFVDKYRPKVKNPAELLDTKGNALYMLGQTKFEEALLTWEEARKIDSSNVNAYHMPGSYLVWSRCQDEGYPLLKKALTLAPNSTSIHQSYWQAILGSKEKSKEKKHEEIEADIALFLQNRGDFAESLLAVAGIYRNMELKEKQKSVEDKVLKNFPESRASEWTLVSRYRDFEDEFGKDGFKDPEKLNQYRKMLKDFIKRPRHYNQGLLGDTYRDLFYSIKDDLKVSGDELLEAVNGMVKFDKVNPHTVYAGGAIALAERKVHFREAERIAKSGISEGQKKIESQRSIYKTEEDYQKALNWMTGLMYDALGWIYFQEGRFEEAEKELIQAYNLDPNSLNNLYHIGKLYEAKGNMEKAEIYYIKGMSVQRPGENPCLKALELLYKKQRGNLEGFDKFLAEIRERDRERRKQEILAARISEPEPAEAFSLKSLDGSIVSLDGLKDKIVVINFWGIWCGWCVLELPDFQKLHEKYRPNPDVVILTINNDTNPDNVPSWMKTRGYDFTVLMDDGYVSDKAKIRAFPTTWFLDRKGRKAFIKVGWSEQLLEEFAWRIEALREK